jgi:hypothetical protein
MWACSWSAHRFLFHLKRNGRASTAIQKRFRFPSKEEIYEKLMAVGVVDIHHHVLKSTTGSWFVWLSC